MLHSPDFYPHHWPVRVYYEDTDAGGIVYHANYLRFMERARSEMMRASGMPIADIAERDKLLFVVGTVTLKYLASARLDDELIVHSGVQAIGRASLKISQNVSKRVANSTKLLLEGDVTLVLINAESRPTAFPQKMRDILQTLLVKETVKESPCS